MGNCENNATKCDIHLNFHGCGFKPEAIFLFVNSVITFNSWGETNNIIIVYPYTSTTGMRGSVAMTSDQTDGCWNVYGKAGDNYAQRAAPQMMAIKNMIDHLLNGNKFSYKPGKIEPMSIADFISSDEVSSAFGAHITLYVAWAC